MNSGLRTYLMLSALILILAGCSTKPTYYIELKLPEGDLSCNGVEIHFLSYDYSRVLDSLAQINNPGPKPDNTELMALHEEYKEALALQTRYADTVNALQEKLEKMDNKSIDYRKLYPVFQAFEKRRKNASEDQKSAYEKYLNSKTAHNAMLKDWEQVAYKGFSEFKEKMFEDFPTRKTKIEITDSDCMVKQLKLPFQNGWSGFLE